jgi:hypothetical protein
VVNDDGATLRDDGLATTRAGASEARPGSLRNTTYMCQQHIGSYAFKD